MKADLGTAPATSTDHVPPLRLHLFILIFILLDLIIFGLIVILVVVLIVFVGIVDLLFALLSWLGP